MIQQLNIRFGKHAISVVRALSLIPRNIDQTQDDTVNEIFNYYKDDLPSPESFRQELRIWKALWNNKPHKPDNITSTITDPRACSTMFPNITKILNLLLLTSKKFTLKILHYEKNIKNFVQLNWEGQFFLKIY